MMAPVASVVIPAHNAAPYIEECLRSWLSQSRQDFEIVIVDDGSTDHTVEIVRQFQSDPRITLLVQEASGTPASPRNRGIRASKGEYVLLFDADDVAHPEKFAATMQAVNAAPPGVAFAITNFSIIGGDAASGASADYLSGFTRLSAYLRQAPSLDGATVVPPDTAYDLLLDGNFVGTSGVAICRRSLERSGLFDETLRYSEDYDLWLRLLDTGQMLVLNRVLHYYRNHSAGISKESDTRIGPARIRVLKKQLHKELTRAQAHKVRQRIAVNYLGIAWELRRAGDLRGAIRHDTEAFRFGGRWAAVRGLLKSSALTLGGPWRRRQQS